MGEIIKKYGLLIISGIITVAMITFLYSDGFPLVIKNAMGITTKSNDNTASVSETAMKNIVERELPEVVGNTDIVVGKEYLITYDSGKPTADYLVRAIDADGNVNETCNIDLLSIKDIDGNELYDAKNHTTKETQQNVIIADNKIQFKSVGIYEIRLRLSDNVGTNQITSIITNANGSEEE